MKDRRFAPFLAPLALTRPRQWVPYLGLPVLGVLSACDFSIRSLGPVLLWCVFYLSGGYAFNGACDAGGDFPEKNVVARGEWSRRAAFVFSLSLFFAAALLAFALPERTRFLALAMIALGIFYSLPHVGLKRLPFVGTLSNVGLFVPLYWIGRGALPEAAAGDFWAAAFLALPSLQSQLIHEAQDQEEDGRAGTRTTARALGLQRIPLAVQGISVFILLGASLAVWQEAFPHYAAFAFGIASFTGLIGEGAREFPLWRRRTRRAYMAACLVWVAQLAFECRVS
ncbi:MAG: UbiA family prenyltransferase [Bdellovibrionota bacterium]